MRENIRERRNNATESSGVLEFCWFLRPRRLGGPRRRPRRAGIKALSELTSDLVRLRRSRAAPVQASSSTVVAQWKNRLPSTLHSTKRGRR
jgi:hypothetical protein